ncbi:MAG: hypothetical protein HYZ74_04235 [Elusimicrobia bacterium]|nr:hypothetical protein [Elusimicrobiota bacterium]
MLDPLSISAPGAPSIPQFSAAASPSEDLAVPSFEAAFSGESAPPATLAVSAGAPAPSPDPVPVPGPEDVMARFAKPAPAVTDVPRKPARSNKLFLAIGAVVVVLLVGVGVIFIKQPKEDLKHMTALDDGQAPIGAPALDEGGMSAPAMAKPRLNSAAQENPPEPAPPSAAAGAAEHAAAIAMVKDFPLDGGRGTVGRWLQYSYTASPDAGTEEWNASTTADNTVLVEYRLVPGPRGGNAALYLFEADVQRGMVIGKNLDARQMLAGGSPAPEKTKKKKAAAPRRKVRKPAPVEEPKVVPLLPLPDSGELRPPAEDDGTFVPDTVNSGI